MLRRTFLAAPALFSAAPKRTPRTVSEQLSRVYGQQITAPVYTQSFALFARARYGQREAARRVLERWLDGSEDSLRNATASHYSGHLAFGELRDRRGDRLLIKAADRAMADPRDNEMSDSVFMVCPLLSRAGQLSGDRRYYEATLQHLKRMEGLCLRSDGIYRHSPLCEAPWGRGNAFPLLGLALCLESTSSREASFDPLRNSFRKLAAGLSSHQHPSGMWRQVIDHEPAWLEFSSTAMIAAAMNIGVRREWLGREYRPRIERAWNSILERIDQDGSVRDVCESTGKMRTLEAYLNRKALRGHDPRGGAMALFLATELTRAS